MKKFASAAALLLAMGAAHAQVYVEGALGSSHVDIESSGVCESPVTCDSNDTGFKLIGGYKFNPNVALEAGYIDFGKGKATVSALGIRASVTSTAFYAGAALRAELGSGFGAVGRFGMARVDSKVRASAPGIVASDSGSSINPLFGLGLEYALMKNLRLTGTMDFTKTAEDEEGETASLRLISIGARFDF